MTVPERQTGTNWNRLSDKEQMFLMEYIRSWSPKDAAVKAGYAPKNAKVTGQKILKRPKIRNWLGAFKRKLFDSCEVDADKLMQRINAGLHRNAKMLCNDQGVVSSNITEMPDEITEQIDGIEQEYSELIDAETGEIKGRKVKTKIKLVPIAQIMRMAIDITGLDERKEDAEGKIQVDWDSMIERPADEIDLVETELKKLEQK